MSKSKITEAFNELRKLGYFARQNFTCCQTCGWAAVPSEKGNKAVFYHNQDNDSLKRSGECHLAWSGDGNEIVSVLNRHGIQTDWDGSNQKRIRIKL